MALRSLAIALAVLVSVGSSSAGTASPTSAAGALRPFFDLDRRFVGSGTLSDADLAQLDPIVSECGKIPRDSRLACLAREVPGRFLRSVGHDANAGTIKSTLETGSTSCTPLVVLVLALASAMDVEAGAVVLRDHVAVIDPASNDVVFDVLDRGRRRSMDETTSTHRPEPGGPRIVSLSTLLWDYGDALAARLGRNGRTEEALAAFDEVVRNAPGSPRARFNRGVLLLRLARYDEAIDELKVAERLGWREAELSVDLGLAYERSRRTEEARARYRRALELDPENRDAKAGLKRVGPGGASGED